MGLERQGVHTHPTMEAEGHINSDGSYSFSIIKNNSYAFGYGMNFYIVINGDTNNHHHIGGWAASTGFTAGGTRTYSGVCVAAGQASCTSAQFYMTCQASTCDKYGGNIWTAPGAALGTPFYFTRYTAPSIIDVTVHGCGLDHITASMSYNLGTNGDPIRQLEAWRKTNAGGDMNNQSAVVRGINSGGWYNLSGLRPNSEYYVYGHINDGTGSWSRNSQGNSLWWTTATINAPALSLTEGSEHNSVTAIVDNPYPSRAYNTDETGTSDSYRVAVLNSDATVVIQDWSSYQDSSTFVITGLEENTTYTIRTEYKNKTSTHNSIKDGTITTWYNPISNLQILIDTSKEKNGRWYWFLAIKSAFTYNGTIKKYEFDIGDQGWVDKELTNGHSRGTVLENQSNNLSPHTAYTCKVRLTDNHDRIATAEVTFYTLEDRIAYIFNEISGPEFVQCFIFNGTDNPVQMTPDLVKILFDTTSEYQLPNEYNG